MDLKLKAIFTQFSKRLYSLNNRPKSHHVNSLSLKQLARYFNFKVESASLAGLENIIIKSYSKKFLRLNYAISDPANYPTELGAVITYIGPHHPGIIYNGGASNCSPILVFDRSGQATAFHDNLGIYDTGAFWQGRVPRKFSQFAISKFGLNKCCSVIGGTRFENNLDSIVTEIRGGLKDLVKDHTAEILLVPKIEHNQTIHRTFGPIEAPNGGFIFVPQYLAKDRKNHILALDDLEQESLIVKRFL